MTEPELSEAQLLSFEAGGLLFALPIAEILEVSEATSLACIPTLERSRGGVMNHRGDALPVVSIRVLLESEVLFDEAAPAESRPASQTSESGLPGQQLLVLSQGEDRSPKFGLPVDSVRGLVVAPADSEKCEGIVRERFDLSGREVGVIDPRQLMARATSVIEGGRTDVHPTTGG